MIVDLGRCDGLRIVWRKSVMAEARREGKETEREGRRENGYIRLERQGNEQPTHGGAGPMAWR
jgi:hypothetical protein